MAGTVTSIYRSEYLPIQGSCTRYRGIPSKLDGSRIKEVLPNLQNIFVEELESLASEPFQEKIGRFVAARRLSNHAIAISVWDEDSNMKSMSCNHVSYRQPETRHSYFHIYLSTLAAKKSLQLLNLPHLFISPEHPNTCTTVSTTSS